MVTEKLLASLIVLIAVGATAQEPKTNAPVGQRQPLEKEIRPAAANRAAAADDGTALPVHAVRRYGSTGVISELSKARTAITADGRLAATVELTNGGTIYLWDVLANRRIASLMRNRSRNSEPHSGSVAFSHDASKVLANWQVGIQVWDLGTRNMLFETPENRRHQIVSAIFSPDGVVVATCSEDAKIRLWDAQTGDELLVLPVPREYGDLRELAFSADANLIAAGTRKGNVALWDLEAGKQVKLIERAHPEAITALLFSPDGRRLYTAGNRSGAYETAPGVTWARHLSEMSVWDVATGDRLIQFKPPKEWVGDPSIGLSEGGKTLYSLHDEKFALWDARTGDLYRVLNRDRLGPPVGPAHEIISLHGPGSQLKRFSIDSRDQLVDGEPVVPIEMARLSDDSNRLITAGREDVHVWDTASGTLTHALEAGYYVGAIEEVSSEGLVLVVTILSDRQKAVTRNQLRAWEFYTGELQYAVRIEGRGRTLAISPDGKLVAVVSHPTQNGDPFRFEGRAVVFGKIEILHVETGNRVASLKAPTSRGDVSLQFSPTSNEIASIAGSEFHLWDIKSGEVRKKFALQAHTRIVPPGRQLAGTSQPTRLYASAISPDLRWAVTAGLGDENVFVWSAEDQHIRHKLKIKGLFTSKLAISRNSRLLAVSARLTGNHDKENGNVQNTITVWDIRQGRRLMSLIPDPKPLPNEISFSTDGKYLISASGTTSAILWDLREALDQLDIASER